MESQFKKSNNNVLIFVVLGAIIFFVFIMPMLDRANASEEAKLKEHLNNTNTEPTNKIDKNMCSKQCCKFTQWPLPDGLIEKTIPEDQLKNYVGSNMSCNFGNGSGCVCVTKDDLNYLSSHGGNSTMCGKV
jgi:hypothetical protein